MILVDTSVWIDHLHRADPSLSRALEADAVGTHPLVIQELALGSIRNRVPFLESLAELHAFPMLDPDEVMELITKRGLWGHGLSVVDVHLLGSTLVVAGGTLWTRDKRLRAAARDAGVCQD